MKFLIKILLNSSITIRWLPGQRIQIKEGDGSYTLTNLDTAQPVSVPATKPIATL
jgi:hypothetical protein